MKLVFTGVQGCGKGTQARKLVKNHGFMLLEMGQEFRKIIESGSPLGKQLQGVLDRGEQVDEHLGSQVMESVILQHQRDNIIFDGFVRNSWNKKIFDKLLPDYKVVFFHFSDEKAMERLLGRMYDPHTGETFPSHLTHHPHTGNLLIKREDDKKQEAIKKRIQEYNSKTLPIVDIQRTEGKVIDINADQTPEEVFNDIITKLEI